MRVLQSSVFRALCAIAVGVLLVRNPDSTVKGITIAIGVMFFLSGVISCCVYLASRMRKEAEVYDMEGNPVPASRPVFPLVGIGSAILGAILALMPETFMQWLMYVLGSAVILCALSQFFVLASASRRFRIPFWYWAGPSVVVVAALFAMVKPMETAGLPLLVIGWCMLLYGVTECLDSIKIYVETRRLAKAAKVCGGSAGDDAPEGGTAADAGQIPAE